MVEYSGTRLIRTSSGHTVREPGVRIKGALDKNVTLFSHFHGHIFSIQGRKQTFSRDKNCLISELRQY